jgi:hypothetical protein
MHKTYHIRLSLFIVISALLLVTLPFIFTSIGIAIYSLGIITLTLLTLFKNKKIKLSQELIEDIDGRAEYEAISTLIFMLGIYAIIVFFEFIADITIEPLYRKYYSNM